MLFFINLNSNCIDYFKYLTKCIFLFCFGLPLLIDLKLYLEEQLRKMNGEYKYDMEYFDGVHDYDVQHRLKDVMYKIQTNNTIYYEEET
jgi:hypothetical protein